MIEEEEEEIEDRRRIALSRRENTIRVGSDELPHGTDDLGQETRFEGEITSRAEFGIQKRMYPQKKKHTGVPDWCDFSLTNEMNLIHGVKTKNSLG